MPFVKETVYINAPPEKVYDVIADVENFWRFSIAILRFIHHLDFITILC